MICAACRSVAAAIGANRAKAAARLANLVISNSLMCFVTFEIEMPAPARIDAPAAVFFLRVNPEKKSREPLGSRLPCSIVAGGFGGSGDDQSGLSQRGQRGRGDQGQGGCEAEKLGHLAPQNCVSELLMHPR